jgi:4-hydroxythreonine-4-phosphate dehydrogenase
VAVNAPAIVVTTGEPAGIGPDISLALALQSCDCRLAFAGDPQVLRDRADLLGLSLEFCTVGTQGPAPHRPGLMQILPHAVAHRVVPGQLDPANARYVLDMLDTAVQGCLSGAYQAMVTAPLQKSVIADTGLTFSGHTEYLAQQTGVTTPVMLLVAGTLRVALATTHLPLAAVPSAINVKDLVATLTALDAGLKSRFHLAHPRILVLGLNPHAGESGHLGREEIDIIGPAIQAARDAGIDARGPLPADTAFTPHALQDGDAVLAMFHDQGLPVLKFAGFGRGVNVTLGLPIIRTSVDHGTALDLAGSGRADAGSLRAALDLALECLQ